MKITKAVILAGGLGTRMLPITKVFPKEMLPIVDKPLLSYIVDDLTKCGINNVLIVSGKEKTSIQNYFENNDSAFFTFVYPNKPNGVVDAILHSKNFVQQDDFILIFGDVLFSKGTHEIKQMLTLYEKTNKSVVGCFDVLKKDKSLYGIIENKKDGDSSYIYNIIEKPKAKQTKSNLAIAGVYVLKNEIFNQLSKLSQQQLFTDALICLANNKSLVAKQIVGEYFDVGNKTGYVKALIYYAIRHNITKSEIKKYIKDIAKTL